VESLARLGDRAFVELLNEMLTADALTGWESRWALHFAGVSHELAFVPALIARLSDRRSNDSFSSTADGRSVAHTLAEDALWGLRRLTFQDFDADPQAWRDWWASNRETTWQTQLQRYVERVLPQMATADPFVMNQLVARVADVDDPAVLPLLVAYFRDPRVTPSAVGPNTYGGEAEVPGALALLSLARQGSAEARSTLYECAASTSELAVDCLRALAVFDHERAVAGLRALTCADGELPPTPVRSSMGRCAITSIAAEALARLADNAAIPALIEVLAAYAQGSSRLANPRHLAAYTQRDIAYDASASADARQAAIAELRAWWAANSDDFVIQTKAAAIDADCCRFDVVVPEDGPYTTKRRVLRLASGSGPGRP
jgi:hypothetical protein